MFNRLYLHIPFCRQKCPYCAFISHPGNEPEIEAYVGLLLDELRIAAMEFRPGPIDSVYFGGGTPSLLAPDQVSRILDRVAQHLDPVPDVEVTLEANPGTVSREQLAELRAAGVNRLSFGVQSFDDRMLKLLGRMHSGHQARGAFDDARSAGFANIGIDLIHALPGQTPDMWVHDLRGALLLGPEHLSVYGLTLEEGTPFALRYNDNDDMPDSDLAADMFEAADELLTGAGYEHYEIANYARPGFRSRHNSGYWRRDGYLGLGVAAHSFIRQGAYGIRFSNPTGPETYAACVKNGQIPCCSASPLSRADALSEFMFLGLRMAEGVTFAAFEECFGASLQACFAPALQKLSAAGLISRDAQGIRLTRRGMLLSNQVFSMFLA